VCLDAGINLFDTADVYSHGQSEEILGAALKGRRSKALISTKTTFREGEGPNDVGHSRHHLVTAVDAALKRLGTDWLDLFILHSFDAKTATEETAKSLEMLVQSGKVRAVGCSNYSGWHTMKTLGIQDRLGFSRLTVQQVNYSIFYRQLEWELMPLALDQNVGTMVWGSLAQGRLSGKFGRGKPLPEGRVKQGAAEGPEPDEEQFFAVLDVLDVIARETGKTVAQVSLNWVLSRPSVSTILVGARTEQQLKDNLGAIGWRLTAEQIERIDRASETPKIYPFWHQAGFGERNPSPVKTYR
jgi:aryl-alcohol dehydrogenase-like predicted oxidoreductase